MIAAETGAMLTSGGLSDQPEWFMELLGWLIPRLDSIKFISKATMILGKSDHKDKHKTFVDGIRGPKRAGNTRRPNR